MNLNRPIISSGTWRAFSGAVALLMLAHQTHGASIAFDDFESYSVGALNGNNGGSGWGAAWTADARVNVVSTGLSYSNGTVNINGGSRSLEFLFNPEEGGGITNGIISRALDASETGTVYMSMLYSDTVNPDLGNDFIQFGFDTATNPRTSIMRRNGTFQARSTTSTSNSADSGINSSVGQTYLLVFKAVRNGTQYDEISLFVNPNSNIEPGTADAVATANSGISSLDGFMARSAFHDLDDTFIMDELTIGTTFADVVAVPEPSILTLLGVGGLLAAFRRERSNTSARTYHEDVV